MTEKKDLASSYYQFKLKEALEKDPLYKDNKKKLEVLQGENDPHEAVSDFLLRVMPQDSINKFNYMLGLNSVEDIKKDPIPNPKKKKMKESLLEEDGEEDKEGESGENAPAENETGSDNIEKTVDVSDLPEEETTSEEDAEEDEEAPEEHIEEPEAPSEDKGVGAIDRIINECTPEEIIKKAIQALNSSDISDARDVFYDWFDQYDDNHYLNKKPSNEEEPSEENKEEGEENDPVGNEGISAENEASSEEKPEEEKPAEGEASEGGDLDLDALFK